MMKRFASTKLEDLLAPPLYHPDTENLRPNVGVRGVPGQVLRIKNLQQVHQTNNRGRNRHGTNSKDHDGTGFLEGAHLELQNHGNGQTEQVHIRNDVRYRSRDIQDSYIEACTFLHRWLVSLINGRAVNPGHQGDHSRRGGHNANTAPDGHLPPSLWGELEVEGEERQLGKTVTQHENTSCNIGVLPRIIRKSLTCLV